MNVHTVVAWGALIVGVALFVLSFFIDMNALKRAFVGALPGIKEQAKHDGGKIDREIDEIFGSSWNIVRGTGVGLVAFGLLLLKGIYL